MSTLIIQLQSSSDEVHTPIQPQELLNENGNRHFFTAQRMPNKEDANLWEVHSLFPSVLCTIVVNAERAGQLIAWHLID